MTLLARGLHLSHARPEVVTALRASPGDNEPAANHRGEKWLARRLTLTLRRDKRRVIGHSAQSALGRCPWQGGYLYLGERLAARPPLPCSVS